VPPNPSPVRWWMGEARKKELSMVREIKNFDDPILKLKCDDVLPVDDLAWVDDMADTCYLHNGAGLAAPQIGIAKRAVFIRYGKDYGLILINPVLSNPSEQTIVGTEGCLSYPGVYVPVTRHSSIHCNWQAFLNGKKVWSDTTMARDFHGHEARVLQHEVDHLDGICRVGEQRHKPEQRSRNSRMVLASLLLACATIPERAP
jgi:peptide deformylase